MPGGEIPPFRAPCEGVHIPNCGFAQHKKGPLWHDRYVFSATVPPGPDGVGDPVPPYERFVDVTDVIALCYCRSHNCDPTAVSAPCSPWIADAPLSYDLGSPPPSSYAHTTGDRVDFALCHKRGHKGVAAMRRFHGTEGRRSQVWLPPSGGEQSAGAITCTIPMLYKNTPDQTRYCKVHAEFSMSDSLNNCSYDGTHDSQVDANTGLLGNALAFTASFPGRPIMPPEYIDTGTPLNVPFTLVHLVGIFTLFNLNDAVARYWVAASSRGGAGAGTAVSVYTHPDSKTWVCTTTVASTGGFEIVTVTCDFAGTFGLELQNGVGAITFDHTTETLTLTDTTAVWAWEHKSYDSTTGVLQNTYSQSLTGTYSTSQTVDDLESDSDTNLLSLWPLNDDALYPWRTDGLFQVMPLVCRNEAPSNIPLTLTVPIDTDPDTGAKSAGTYTDPTATLYDGAIIGGPKPAGYENTFAWQWLDWHACVPMDDSCLHEMDWYDYGYGISVNGYRGATGAQLPLNATFFTNNWQVINKPPGAWVMTNDGKIVINNFNDSPAKDKEAFWKCKYAEAIDTWPSQNFARPAGDDKFAYDETQVVGVKNLTGSGPGATFTAINYLGNDTTIADTSGIWGGTSVGGFYLISGVVGSVVTLGAKQFSVPSNWKNASGDEGFSFGKLRWSDKPSLLGRVGIRPDVAGTTFRFEIPQPTFGMSTGSPQENVSLFDANMTLLASPVPATRVDDNSFTVGTSHPTAKFVQIVGAAHYYINDNKPKGDFGILSFTLDYRTFGENTRLAGAVDCSGTSIQPALNNGYSAFSQTPECLPYTRCEPKVICISPNGETWANGITIPFPSVVHDPQYGSRLHIWPEVTMTELFWEVPHKPLGLCDPDNNDKLVWQMDDGSCTSVDHEDTDEITGAITFFRYYAHAPQVETRFTVPCNYGPASDECGPALPTGIQVGWLSPVTHAPGAGVASPPPEGGPSLNGLPQGVDSSFQVQIRQCGADDGCRFGKNKTGC